MNKIQCMLLVTSIAILALLAFNKHTGGVIIGHITPAEGGSTAWAISKKDTLKAEISPKGIFQLPDLTAGTYKVVIEAKAPFKNFEKADVVVTDVTTDVGEIVLEK